MQKALAFGCVLLGAVFVSTAPAAAACGPGDPTGYFRGTAQSKEAGKLDVGLNLRCDGTAYGGELETPLGAFAIREGSYAGGTLTLTFGPDPTGAVGTIVLAVVGDSASGTFRLGADSGTFIATRVGGAHAPRSAVPNLDLTAAQWREDLTFLANALKTRHVSPFEFTSRSAFDRETAALDRGLERLNGDQVYVGLDRLTNLIGDGHTYVEFPPDVAAFPIVLRRFGNDYRIVAAVHNGTLLGMRVAAIDGTPIAAVRQSLWAMTPIGETQILRDTRTTNFMSLGIALHGAGVIQDRAQARFTVIDDAGQATTVSLHALTPEQAGNARYTFAWNRRPLYREHPDDDFWFTYLPAEKTVYCDFRGYNDLEKHASALFEVVRARHPQKLAVDLRLNGGGDFKAGLRFLIDPIARLPEVNRRGHLFVLVGPSTFSAAMSNAAQFRQRTHALLVGQTIGERPNSNQEPNQVELPNSHLTLRYSTKRYRFAPHGPNAIIPDKTAAPTWPEFRAGRDPALDWVLRYPVRT